MKEAIKNMTATTKTAIYIILYSIPLAFAIIPPLYLWGSGRTTLFLGAPLSIWYWLLDFIVLIAIMLTMIALFFAGIIAILYITLKRSRSFDDYAVAGRSFGPWYVAMCYVNSWWPGTVFISFAGISVTSGVFGFYGLAYSTLGLAFMYFIATRAW